MSDLAGVIAAECAELSVADAFAYVRAKTKTKNGLAKSGEVLAFFASIGKLKLLRAIAADDSHALNELADAAITTIESREGFDFSLPAVVSMLQLFVDAGVFDSSECETLIALGQSEVPYFDSVSFKQVLSLSQPELIAVDPVESDVLTVSCSRNQGVLLSAAVSGVPAQTSVEVYIATSVDGVEFTQFKYSGSMPVGEGAVTQVVSVAPQATALFNKVKLLSREYVIVFDSVTAVAY